MDIILSIPIISYLYNPANSVSTSVNLVFFYMTWATLVLSHPPWEVHLVGVLAIRTIFWFIPALISLLFDLAIPSLAESVKHAGRASLPPRKARPLFNLLGLVLFNVFAMTATEGAVSYVYRYINRRTVFKMSTTLPFPWQMAKHILVLTIAREILTYYLHRYVLHNNPGSPIAKLHQQFAHSTRGAPYCIQLFYDHPLPLIVHRFIPLFLPCMFLRPHMITYFLYLAICTGEEAFSMSGYTIVPGYFLSGIAARSSLHYAGSGSSNFGAWGVVDWCHGTSRGRDIFDDLRAEADKHHLQERSAAKASQGADDIKSGFDKGLDALKSKTGKKAKKT